MLGASNGSVGKYQDGKSLKEQQEKETKRMLDLEVIKR